MSAAATTPPRQMSWWRLAFNQPEEFAAELRERRPNVEPVVRLTFRWRRDPEGLPCCHLSVVAGYLHKARGVPVLRELVHYAGEVWDGLNEEVSARTRESANRARQIVECAAREASIAVAGGAYSVPGGPDGKRLAS